MEKPNKETYDLNDHWECLRYAKDLKLWGEWLEKMLTPTEKSDCISNVIVSLPVRDEANNVGFKIAKNADYNYRRVLNDQDHDIYYSGWMDCYDWILKSNER